MMFYKSGKLVLVSFRVEVIICRLM